MKTLVSIFVLLAVVFFNSGVDAANAPKPKKTDPTFKVMSYNIRLNTESDGENAWPKRKDKVTGLLKFHQPDIFGIQEALADQMNDMKLALPAYDSYGIGRDDGHLAGEFMSIFYLRSRYTKLGEGTFWLSPTPEKPSMGWDAMCYRTCTWIRFRDKLSNKKFYLFNTHFDHMGKVARYESAKLILLKIKEINKENLPVILTGDFNSTRGNEPIQYILREMKDARDISEAKPYGPAGTSGGFDVKVMPNIIDYIFVNSLVRVKRYAVLSDSFGMFYPSDHLPVFTELQLK